MAKNKILFFSMLLRFLTITTILFGELISVQAQTPEKYSNQTFITQLNNTIAYTNLKRKIAAEYNRSRSGHWGEFVEGVCEDLKTNQKIVALTFDACGGEKGTGYDNELIDFLRKEKIPATLFVTGRWIDAHYPEFINMAHDTLFEIENHGLNHRPCTISGRSVYGIKGTANPPEAFEEVEGNAQKIEAITGRRPHFYRSATAFIDEAGAAMVRELGMIPVSYQVLSGDASADASKATISNNVLKAVRPGAIIIMHMNHPQWNSCEALKKIVPELRKMGYRFAHLNNCKLTDREGKT